ncbi:MAG TPA: energy transducer TonB [Bryobacteraceae bacterium]|nr:energy transducer TonB [Bryobacteraceae bacterium]
MPLIEPPVDVDSSPAATAPTMAARVPESSAPPRRSRHLWIWLVCLAGGGAAASSYLFLPHQPRLESASAASDAFRPIGFSARAENGKLLLTWNAASEAVKSARRAVLSITDGNRVEDVELLLPAFHRGAMVYQPVTTDVMFRLTVSSDGVADAIESVRPAIWEEPVVPAPEVAADGQSGPPADAAAAGATPRIARQFAPPSSAAPSTNVPNVSEPPAIEGSATSEPAGIELPGRRLTAPAPPAAPAPAPRHDPAPAVATPAAVVAHAPAGPVRVGALTVLRRTVIPYPPYAKRAHVGGTVSVEVTVGADGRVRKAVAIGGPESLRIAAEGVKDWRFEPPVVGGKPVEAIGRVDVTFTPRMR